MQTTWKITEADRDSQGRIKVAADEPRSLADLLPKPEAIRQDAKRQPHQRAELAGLAVVALCAIAIIAYAWGTPSAAPTPQIERATIMQPTVPAARPTVAPTAAAPVRMLAAFDQPDGMLLGQIEETRAIMPVAHYGGEWVQADVAGSGLVWIRAADMPGLAIVGPDLAPPPPAPPRPQVIYVSAPERAYAPIEAPPTLEPPPPPTLAPQQMVILDRQQWAEAAAQHNGGSGKMDAPDFGTMDANAQWCAAAHHGARCVEP